VGPRATLDAAEKSLSSLQRLEPRLLGRPAPRRLLCRLTYPRSGCGQFRSTCRRSAGGADESHEQFHSEAVASGESSQTAGRRRRGYAKLRSSMWPEDGHEEVENGPVPENCNVMCYNVPSSEFQLFFFCPLCMVHLSSSLV
jgi:hypothetical protein